MPDVFWFDEPLAAFEALEPRDQAEIRRRLRHLRDFPELYERLLSGRYRGLRHFVVRQRILVIYQYVPETDQCYIVALRHARARPT